MKKYSIFLSSVIIFSTGISITSARSYDRYDPYYETTGISCSYGSSSVGVGLLPDGVVVTIDSGDYATSQCIKNTSWASYFTTYGNSVSISLSNTTLGVQIVATSMDTTVSDRLKNAQWSRLITGRSNTYITTESPRKSRTNRVSQRKKPVETYYYYTPVYTTPQYFPYTPTYAYPSQRSYVAGSTIFPTSQMFRYVSFQSNGAKMTLSSPDYRTMVYLQGYQYATLFSNLSGISIVTSNIAGGVEVTVTAGSTSTADEIKRIVNALIYN